MLKHKEIVTEIEQTIGRIHEVLAIELTTGHFSGGPFNLVLLIEW